MKRPALPRFPDAAAALAWLEVQVARDRLGRLNGRTYKSCWSPRALRELSRRLVRWQILAQARTAPLGGFVLLDLRRDALLGHARPSDVIALVDEVEQLRERLRARAA
jgi:hypothetical protein